MLNSRIATGLRRAASALLFLGTVAALGAERNLVKVDHWVTNDIEVRMPVHRFVDIYRTNFVERRITNIIHVFVTNVVRLTATNRVVIDAISTNTITACRTNLKTMTLTNWETVVVIRTNWVKQPMTNFVDIDMQATQSAAAEAPARTRRASTPVSLR